MAEGGSVWQAYHYRTSSRFGSYVEISVVGDTVTVTGRRVKRASRDLWILAQGVLMALTGLSLLSWMIDGGRRRLSRTLRFAFWEYMVAAFGALFVWWPADRGPRGFLAKAPGLGGEAGELAARRTFSSASFHLSEVRDARVTRWYSRGSLIWVSWPWQLLMNTGPDKHNTVVFEVPDDERPGETLVYAMLFDTAEEASQLVWVLRGWERRRQPRD